MTDKADETIEASVTGKSYEVSNAIVVNEADDANVADKADDTNEAVGANAANRTNEAEAIVVDKVIEADNISLTKYY